MANDEGPEERQEPDKKFSLVWSIYGQVAAMIGALSLVVFAGNFVDLGLKGVIQGVAQWWIENVRPVVGSFFQWLIDFLPETWRFKLSDFWKDYFAVGLVMVMSYLRTLSTRFGATNVVKIAMKFPILVAYVVFGLILFLFAWPGVCAGIVLGAFVERDRDFSTFVAIIVSPLVYFGLLLAANAWL